MSKIKFYVFKETHLPPQGWLQGCFICNIITGSIETFYPNNSSIYNTDYIVHLCETCKLLKAQNDNLNRLYISQVIEYILSHPC